MDDYDADFFYKIKFKKDLVYDIDCDVDSRVRKLLSDKEKHHILSSIIKRIDAPYDLTKIQKGE
jgi:hypothetical protein